MIEITRDQLLAKAADLPVSTDPWHFHILTAGCPLNANQGASAFVVEFDGIAYVSYSAQPDRELGKRLLSHVRCPSDGLTASPEDLARDLREVLVAAGELTDTGVAWHHHVLFPDCAFNRHGPRWTVRLEWADEVVQCTTAADPKAGLVHLEELFYRQATVS